MIEFIKLSNIESYKQEIIVTPTTVKSSETNRELNGVKIETQGKTLYFSKKEWSELNRKVRRCL